MTRKSDTELAVEAAHASVCKAGFVLVMMLVKRKMSPAGMREAAERLKEAQDLVQGICDGLAKKAG